jgi:hypothetical protein
MLCLLCFGTTPAIAVAVVLTLMLMRFAFNNL